MTHENTPLPWRVSRSDSGIIYVTGADDNGVCVMDGLLERREADASIICTNARLVSAAREMLESHSMDNVGVGASRRRIAAKEALRAALSRAYLIHQSPPI